MSTRSKSRAALLFSAFMAVAGAAGCATTTATGAPHSPTVLCNDPTLDPRSLSCATPPAARVQPPRHELLSWTW